jgi:ADP-heptose:LPS heptosyltransferase
MRRGVIRALRAFVRPPIQIPDTYDFSDAKLLLLRQDLIGDALISTPLIRALHNTYPRARIHLLLSSMNYFVFDNHPAISKRWVFQKNPYSIARLLSNIRAERYDFVIDLLDNSSATSTLLTLLAGARWKVGLQKENDFVYDIVRSQGSKQQIHVAERTLQLASAFRINPATIQGRVEYFTSTDSERFAQKIWRKRQLDNRPVVGVNISAGEETRSWWRESCRDTLLSIADIHSEAQFVLLHKPSHRFRADDLRSRVKNAIVVSTASFDQAAAIVKRLSILITPDTSIVQLASVFQVPSIVLHIQTSEKHGHLWSPFRSPSEDIVAQHDNLDTIPAREIVAAFERLWISRRVAAREYFNV